MLEAKKVNCMLNVIISLPNSCTVSKFPRFSTLVRTLLVLSFQRFSIRSFACNVLILSIKPFAYVNLFVPS